MGRDPWTVLGLRRGCSLLEIKAAYRQACFKHHPDLVEARLRPSAELHFREISEAYQRLSRGARPAGAHQRGGGGTGPGSAGPRFSNGIVGAVLTIPLVLTGVHLSQHSTLGTEDAIWRPHGIFQPPHNPYLRDDLRPRTYSRLAAVVRSSMRPPNSEEAAPPALPSSTAGGAAAAGGVAAAGGC